jgi:RNA polymerase sigma factor (sigma-70 family)
MTDPQFTAELTKLLPRLRAYIWRCARGDHDFFEELLSGTMLNAWRYRRSYDPKRGDLMTWLYLTCRAELIRLKRLQKREKRQGTVLNVESCENELPTLPATQDDDRLAVEIRHIAKRLKGRPRAFVNRMLKGHSQADIAEEDGISRERVGQITKIAVAEMRRHVARGVVVVRRRKKAA